MAGAGRIRHKLVLGLGLVVGIMAVLLTGSLKGLRSFNATLKSIDSKRAELGKAHDLEAALGDLLGTGLQHIHLLREKIAAARAKLAEYEEQLDETLQLRRDPSGGFEELPRVAQLHNDFNNLDKAIEAVRGMVASGRQARQEEEYYDAVKLLRQHAEELRETLHGELGDRIGEGKRYYRNSMILVIGTGALGLVLLVSLTRFTYLWIFHPVRELTRGARRVGQGDFAHRIEVRSNDEMEDLAGAFNDMTGRLHAMYSDLARQVNERSRQLVRSERLAGVGFLAAGVAHEINNPLASIAFCSEALESRLKEVADGGLRVVDAHGRSQAAGVGARSPDRALAAGARSGDRAPTAAPPADWATIMKYLGMIQQEAFRCKEITQRLLEFSRGGERKREPTDLAEVMQAVLDMVQHLQNCKGKRIIFQPAGRLVAWVNAQEIKSVVLNLVVNALDSMDEGGTLTIALRQAAGKSAAPADRVAELEFADTGCGMTEDVLENIFEPFFTRSRTGKGTGLGLSISHRVVSQHGGEIEATSRGPGQGSTFTVRVPVQPAESVKEETFGRAAA